MQRCPDPDGTGMVPVGGFVAVGAGARRGRRGQEVFAMPGYMPGRPQKLRRFENHLDDVTVAVPLGSLRGIE
jgi:hypothetical protein